MPALARDIRVCCNNQLSSCYQQAANGCDLCKQHSQLRNGLTIHTGITAEP